MTHYLRPSSAVYFAVIDWRFCCLSVGRNSQLIAGNAHPKLQTFRFAQGAVGIGLSAEWGALSVHRKAVEVRSAPGPVADATSVTTFDPKQTLDIGCQLFQPSAMHS